MQILMYDVYGWGILTSLRNERGRKVIEIAKLHIFLWNSEKTMKYYSIVYFNKS